MPHFYRYDGAANPEVYELENLAADPEQLIEAEMQHLVPFSGTVMLDIGAGSGFHTFRFASSAEKVFAVEPDQDMIEQFRARFTKHPCPNVELIVADAEQIPLPDSCIDIAHARFAYFFGTEDCEPGIAEVKRMLKPGGHFFVIDNYYGRGQFAHFCELAYKRNGTVQQTNDVFYQQRGFHVNIIDSCWRTANREELRCILQMEFPDELIEQIMSEITGVELSYSFALYHYQKPA